MTSDNGAMIISIVSLGVSTWTLYFTHLSPFRATIAVGTPGWRVETMEAQGEQRQVVTLTLPIVITNSGSRMGVVQDMLSELHHAGRAHHLVPTFFADVSKHVEGISAQDSPVSTSAPLFRPIILGGRQQIEKTVVFLPERSIALEPGRYSVSLCIRAFAAHADTASWQRHFVGSFELTNDDVSEMQRGMVLEKVSDEIRSARTVILQRRQ